MVVRTVSSEEKIARYRDEIVRLREHIERLEATVKIKERNLRDYYIGQALSCPRLRGENAQGVAADAERIAEACMRQRRLWEAGLSQNQLASPDRGDVVPEPPINRTIKEN